MFESPVRKKHKLVVEEPDSVVNRLPLDILTDIISNVSDIKVGCSSLIYCYYSTCNPKISTKHHPKNNLGLFCSYFRVISGVIIMNTGYTAYWNTRFVFSYMIHTISLCRETSIIKANVFFFFLSLLTLVKSLGVNLNTNNWYCIYSGQMPSPTRVACVLSGRRPQRLLGRHHRYVNRHPPHQHECGRVARDPLGVRWRRCEKGSVVCVRPRAEYNEQIQADGQSGRWKGAYFWILFYTNKSFTFVVVCI